MPRITKVYTRTGDDGTTALGSGQRVPKDSPRIAAYGTVDEVNSQLGLARSARLDRRVAEVVAQVQNDLFHLGSDLCIPEEDKQTLQVPGIEKRHVDYLEELIDGYMAELAPLKNFILPGGSPGAAHLHVARAACRRAERELVILARTERLGEFAIQYLNRLSDALFVLARYENHRQGVDDVFWDSRA